MAFVRWDPLGDLLAIQQRLQRVAPDADWTPAVDLFETDEAYVLSAEVPGLDRDDLQVRVEHGCLTVAGLRRHRQSPSDRYQRLERGRGRFSRTFQLPLPVDAGRVSADLRDGVLTVTCPKATGDDTRRIEIG